MNTYTKQGTDERQAEQDKQYEALQKIGRCAMDSIRGMVAALECDYDRLDELKADRDLWVENEDGDEDEQTRTSADWAKEFPDDAEELAELEGAAGECSDRDDAERRIQEDPLSLEYRSDWTTPGEKLTPAEFCLLLSTGGPATRIIGELDNGGVSRCRLQAQDWFAPWTDIRLESGDDDILETFCQTMGVGCEL